MTRGICVCGRVGYAKCTVHGDPVKGVGVTDGEFRELVARNKGAILEVFAAGDAIPFCDRYGTHFEDDKGICLSCKTTAAERERKEIQTKKIGRLQGKAVGR